MAVGGLENEIDCGDRPVEEAVDGGEGCGAGVLLELYEVSPTSVSVGLDPGSAVRAQGRRGREGSAGGGRWLGKSALPRPDRW